MDRKFTTSLIALALLWTPAVGAQAALQAPPQCLLTDNPPCQGLGWNNTTKQWVKQAPASAPPPVTITGTGAVTVTGGPPNPYVINAPIITLQAGTGIGISPGPNPYIITNTAGGGSGGLTYARYNPAVSIAPNTWIHIYDSGLPTNNTLTLPVAGVAPFTIPSVGTVNNCITNHSATVTITLASAGGPLRSIPNALVPNGGTVCFSVDDQTPTGWSGDGG